MSESMISKHNRVMNIIDDDFSTTNSIMKTQIFRDMFMNRKECLHKYPFPISFGSDDTEHHTYVKTQSDCKNENINQQD